jgi:hypothetical protein
VTARPARLDPDIASVNPTYPLQGLHKYGKRGLALRGVRSEPYEHANATHAFGLLRPGNQRITSCETAE